jgi:hypothetical protein
MNYDSFGYSCYLLHLVSMLKSKEFNIYLNEVRALVASTEGEKKKTNGEEETLLSGSEWLQGDAPKRQKNEA